MTRIPREYTAQDHLDTARHFTYNVSVKPEVVAGRKELRGKRVNIINDQSAGLDVGNRVLAALEDPDHQSVWANLYGGTILNSALYMFRETNSQPMSRRFKLPQLAGWDGELRDSNETRRQNTLEALDVTKSHSEDFERVKLKRIPSEGETTRLARRLGNVSMLVGVFSTDFMENDDEMVVMQIARQQVSDMHHAVQALAQRIKVNPSLAQLRAESTPLGVHIKSHDYPLEIKSAFVDALGEVSDPQGY
ncbi:MAG TPA: hypothetical protein PLZ58_04185 [Candidatus Saccharibacteria bacterium]|nr:hypothetical protein [Candidatus Saccharibacteria bacterium]HRQ06773.1 hypothetical protein [Candidatus Saccharibacteria bacterium]